MESLTGMTPLRTVIIGSGNVAHVVGLALEKAGAIEVCQVCSPTPGHAAELASRFKDASAAVAPEEMAADAELYLVAVSDDAIATVADTYAPNGAVWLHTSGGVPADALKPLSPDYGVFYPLQTYSRDVSVDFSEVPVFVEGATPRAIEVSKRLAHALSEKVYEVDGDQRCRLHAAAVFACNFANHVWAMSDDILRREVGADISVLRPLIEETVRKAMSMRPALGQTGPARRGDTGVIEKHKSLLLPDEAEIYGLLSNHIIEYYERNRL